MLEIYRLAQQSYTYIKLTMCNFLTFRWSESMESVNTSFLRETKDSTKTAEETNKKFLNIKLNSQSLRFETQYNDTEKSNKLNSNLSYTIISNDNNGYV